MLQEIYNMYNHAVVKWNEVAQMFRLVDYVMEMTGKKSCTLNMIQGYL